jgi:putative ABC transport system permease protein
VGESSPGWMDNPVGTYTYRVWRERSRSFEHLAVMHRTERSIEGRGDPLIVEAAHVSANFFNAIDIQPALGRTFDRGAPENAIVISDHLWRRLGTDPGILGTTLRIVDRPYVVVGVMPPMTVSGPFIGLADYWTWSGSDPMRQASDEEVRPSSFRGRSVIGRLKPGVSLDQARSELAAIQRQLAAEYPQFYGTVGITVTALDEVVVGSARSVLAILFASAGFLLLIACANVANLLLARSVARQREVAIRMALGARRWHIVRQFLIESLVLSIVGGVVGILVVAVGLGVLVPIIGASVPRMEAVSINVRVLLFSVGMTLVTGVLFGMAPALAAARGDVHAATRDAARGTSSGPGRQRLRRVLVSAEVALSIVLLAGSALLVRSFMKLSEVDLGFRPEHVLTGELRIPDLTYPVERGNREALLRRLLSRLQSLPGVTHVGASYYFPFSARQNTQYVIVEGRPHLPGQEPAVEYTGVIGDYLTAMGIPLIRGRLWTAEEMWERPGGVVVSQSMARMLWPDEDPIGKRLTHNRATRPGWMTVIGIVGDVRQRSVDRPPLPQWYFPYSNFSWPLMTVVLRTAGDPSAAIPAMRQAVRDIDPNLPLHRIRPLDDLVAATMARRRLAFGLLAGFAAMALLLAALGAYAAVATAVAQRTQEIGIRIVLGATRSTIVRLVMRDSLLMVVMGSAAGMTGGLLASRLMHSLLFGVSPADGISFAAATLILTAVSGIASYLPARRAAAVEAAALLQN